MPKQYGEGVETPAALLTAPGKAGDKATGLGNSADSCPASARRPADGYPDDIAIRCGMEWITERDAAFFGGVSGR